MKALILEKHNEPLVLREIPLPLVAEGQVLVQIVASAVNPLDVKIRAGKSGYAGQQPPAVLGLDMAGIVVEDGNGFKAGDEVYGMVGGAAGIQGTLAEYAAVDADLLALKPANLSMREAAALPVTVITAWEGLVSRAHIHAGQQVLIHGGAAGVGYIATQIALVYGAVVSATGSPEQKAVIEANGATFIDYTNSPPLMEYDIVMDNVGGATLDASFAAVKEYTGHVVSAQGWGNHVLAPLSFRNATYSGIFVLRPLISGKGRARYGEILREATKLAEAGLLKPRLDPRNFTLENTNDAYAAIENRTAKGKLVVNLPLFSSL
jgi:NADPH:quinone reductase-like Zn-dependent oxidoreductase